MCVHTHAYTGRFTDGMIIFNYLSLKKKNDMILFILPAAAHIPGIWEITYIFPFFFPSLSSLYFLPPFFFSDFLSGRLFDGANLLFAPLKKNVCDMFAELLLFFVFICILI